MMKDVVKYIGLSLTFMLGIGTINPASAGAAAVDTDTIKRANELLLIMASIDGDLDKVTELLKAGVNANCANSEGHTPLMFAATRGHTDVAKALLNANTNFLMENAKGQTALQLAINANHPEITALIQAAMAASSFYPPVFNTEGVLRGFDQSVISCDDFTNLIDRNDFSFDVAYERLEDFRRAISLERDYYTPIFDTRRNLRGFKEPKISMDGFLELTWANGINFDKALSELKNYRRCLYPQNLESDIATFLPERDLSALACVQKTSTEVLKNRIRSIAHNLAFPPGAPAVEQDIRTIFAQMMLRLSSVPTKNAAGMYEVTIDMCKKALVQAHKTKPAMVAELAALLDVYLEANHRLCIETMETATNNLADITDIDDARNYINRDGPKDLMHVANCLAWRIKNWDNATAQNLDPELDFNKMIYFTQPLWQSPTNFLTIDFNHLDNSHLEQVIIDLVLASKDLPNATRLAIKTVNKSPRTIICYTKNPLRQLILYDGNGIELIVNSPTLLGLENRCSIYETPVLASIIINCPKLRCYLRGYPKINTF